MICDLLALSSCLMLQPSHLKHWPSCQKAVCGEIAALLSFSLRHGTTHFLSEPCTISSGCREEFLGFSEIGQAASHACVHAMHDNLTANIIAGMSIPTERSGAPATKATSSRTVA